jgi:hypothetical protein
MHDKDNTAEDATGYTILCFKTSLSPIRMLQSIPGFFPGAYKKTKTVMMKRALRSTLWDMVSLHSPKGNQGDGSDRFNFVLQRAVVFLIQPANSRFD